MIQKRGLKRFKKNNKKIICILMIILISFSFQTALANKIFSEEISQYNSLTLEYKFSFYEPKLQEKKFDNKSYTKISMPGTFSIGKEIGTPVYQTKTAQILLPQGTKLKNIILSTEEKVEINKNTMSLNLKQKPIIPYQKEKPFGQMTSKLLEINQDSYKSKEKIPTSKYKAHGIGYCRGYSILTIDLHPTQYIPSEGKLFYYPIMNVKLNLQETGDTNRFYRNNQNDEEWVKNLVNNPEVIDSYKNRDLDASFYDGGICEPDEDFDYVIIVKERLYDFSGTTYNWDDFISRKNEAGIKTTKVKVEDITACNDYHNSDSPVDDQEAQIREFCRDAYQDWGIEYILIAGDHEGVSAIPRRLMKYEYEGNVESDIYWSNLDKTFNADGDDKWGEEKDGGFDLYSELFIGSIPCDEAIDLSNWMTKSFYYEDSKEIDYLNNNAFYGGDTGWSCQGDDFIDYSAIKGTDNWLGPDPGSHGSCPDWLGFLFGFETWNKLNPDKKFDNDIKWTAEPPNPGWDGGSEEEAREGLKNAINNNEVTILMGIAHANSEHSLDTPINQAADKYGHGTPYWNDHFHNTKPFFLHDYGCHCGDMSASDDGVLHSMLFRDDQNLAFGCVYNTCYGWGSQYDTNSSSALQQKLFCDYFFDLENNSHNQGNWQLGKAMAYSKDAMAPTINWTYSGSPGSWRGIIQGCLLFADPALTISLASPELSFEPTINDFGQMYKGETDTTSFEIWNSNIETLTYEISEDYNWISISPIEGSSEGEHNTIEVNIDTTNLDYGNHSCDINIESNGGNGVFRINVNVISRPPDPPINPKPDDKDKGVETSPTLSVDVSDIDGDVMEVIFYNAEDNSIIETVKNIKSGETASIEWINLLYGESYSWYVVVNDGVFETQSETFSFTTNSPPVFSNIYPIDNSTNVSMFLKTLKINIKDPEGDSFDWSITSNPDIGQNQGTNSLNFTRKCDITGLEPLKEYKWTVEAIDINGAANKVIYTFNTKENTPPEKPNVISPKNNEIDIEIDSLMNWTCNDPDQGDELVYDLYFGKNVNLPLIKQEITNTYYDISYNLDLNTKYYWKIVATDKSGASNTSQIWSFTTSPIPPPIEDVSITFPKKFCWPGIKAEIENTGDKDASNIQWSISVKGGFLNKTNMVKTGNIKRLNLSEKKEISNWNLLDLKSNFKSKIFGFGKITVEVEAKDISGDRVGLKIVEGNIIGPFVWLILS